MLLICAQQSQGLFLTVRIAFHAWIEEVLQAVKDLSAYQFGLLNQFLAQNNIHIFMKYRQKSLLEYHKESSEDKPASRIKRSRKDDPLYHFYDLSDQSNPKVKRKHAEQYEEKKKKPVKKAEKTQTIVYDQEQCLTFELVRVDPRKNKKIKEVKKIFDPDQYQANILRKSLLEQQLRHLHQKFGQELPKVQGPIRSKSAWDHLLKQVQEFHSVLATRREDRVRFGRKMSKQCATCVNKTDSNRQTRQRQQQNKLRKHDKQVAKLVIRDFWGSIKRIKCYFDGLEEYKLEKELLESRLESMVEKQLELSKKINAMVSQNTQNTDAIEGRLIVQLGKPFPTLLGVKCMPKQPLLLKHQMRDYQLQGMRWIVALHDKRMNGVLADQMGLGKTIQTIGMLAYLAISKGIWGPHLIIVPSSIIVNWEIELKRWCPAFKIMTYFGTPIVRKEKRKGWSKVNQFHICITSYKLAVVDHAIFRRRKWYYMILDQAHLIKNFNSLRWQVLINFNTRARLLLTGTPLQNDICQLWSLLHFLMSDLFSSFEDFKQWFSQPVRQALQQNKQISKQIVTRLHDVIRPFFLRRLKKDVEKQLPSKTEYIVRCQLSRRQRYLYDEFINLKSTIQSLANKDTLGLMNSVMQLKKVCNHPDLFMPKNQAVPFRPKPLSLRIPKQFFLEKKQLPNLPGFLILQRQLYWTHHQRPISPNIFKELAIIHARTYQKMLGKSGFWQHDFLKSEFAHMLQCLETNVLQSTRRSQFIPIYGSALRFLNIYKQKINGPSIQTRIEPFLEIKKQFIFVVPKVAAQTPVLDSKMISPQLPTAQLRCMLDPFDQIASELSMKFQSKSSLLYDSSKLLKMVSLVQKIKSRGSKVLIFTQMSKMLDIFQKILTAKRLTYVRLDGSTKIQDRQKLVERFNNDYRVIAFISSTRAGGIGLNLTGANCVIFYDTDWNPQMDRQAQDRCHRIGQTRDVKIYRLICQHTIQQNILLKSMQKKRVQEMVTEHGMFDLHGLQQNSIKSMISGVFEQRNIKNMMQFQDAEDQVQAQNPEQDQKIDYKQLPKLVQYGIDIAKNFDLQIADEDQQGFADVNVPVQQIEEEEAELLEEQKQQWGSGSEENSSGSVMVVEQWERMQALALYNKNTQFIKQNFLQ